jgi:hypothetical protein
MENEEEQEEYRNKRIHVIPLSIIMHLSYAMQNLHKNIWQEAITLN